MAGILNTGRRRSRTLGVSLLLVVLPLVYGAASALASPGSPTATNAAWKNVSVAAIVDYERIGQSGAYVHDPLTAAVGRTVQYKIVVTNQGDTPLTVSLSDPGCDSGTLTPGGTPTIATGGKETYFCTHRLVEADAGNLVNTATATGETVRAAKIGPVSSRVLVTVSASGVLGARKVVVHAAAGVGR